jgi:hypothetical protein
MVFPQEKSGKIKWDVSNRVPSQQLQRQCIESNNYRTSMMEGFEQVTEVAEDISLKETAGLALSIRPAFSYY